MKHLSPKLTVEERIPFWMLRTIIDSNGCWLWQGSTINRGYAVRGYKGKRRLLHKLVWESINGPVPSGLELDHTCHSNDLACKGGDGCLHRRCWNPDHLEAVTRKVNHERGRRSRLRTHCLRGHEYTPQNTRYDPNDGHRVCRKCKSEWMRLVYKHRNLPRHPKEARTHCSQGHEFTEANTWRRKDNSMRCRICHRNTERERRKVA